MQRVEWAGDRGASCKGEVRVATMAMRKRVRKPEERRMMHDVTVYDAEAFYRTQISARSLQSKGLRLRLQSWPGRGDNKTAKNSEIGAMLRSNLR